MNVTDYLMYRHCLLYNDVAKDTAFINSDPTIRFYFKDDRKEKEKLRKLRQEANKAKTNFVACIADNTLFEAMYIQYCLTKGLPIISALAEDDIVNIVPDYLNEYVRSYLTQISDTLDVRFITDSFYCC